MNGKWLVLALGTLLALGGCSGYSTLKEAETRFSEATAKGGEKAAPYEYELSRQYLDLARHETEEGDSAGTDYSRKSMDYADKAIEKSKGVGK